jgi:hypothetical protein
VGGNSHDLILNYIQHLHGERKENQENRQNSRCPCLDSNRELSKYKLEALPFEPICSVEQERKRDKRRERKESQRNKDIKGGNVRKRERIKKIKKQRKKETNKTGNRL